MATFYPVPPLLVKTELHHEFYRLPNNYTANFSTNYGLLPKRGLGYPLTPTIAHTDLNKDVSKMAADLQRAWPDLIWDLNKKPNRWEDLLVWFDPYDIHLMGAKFLLQVLYTVQEQNEKAAAQIDAVIDEAAIDWVSRNEAVVSHLRSDQDVLQLVPAEETLGMKDREMIMFSIALDKHRHLLHARLVAERNGGFVNPTPFASPMIHGVPPFHPAYVPHLAMNQHIVGVNPIRPVVQQTRTAERLMNGLRLSAAGQSNSAAYPPRKEGHQRPRDVSNHSALHVAPQARIFSHSHTDQGKPQPRKISTSRRVRPRGYSTISARNEVDGARSFVQRRASNPGFSPPIFVPTSRPDLKDSVPGSTAYRSPPGNQPLVDPAIIAHSPPRPRALVDPEIIAQSPPRQQPLNDSSIIAQGPERTPHTSPNQVRRMQHNSEFSQAQYTNNAPYAVPSTMQPMSRDSRAFPPHFTHNPPMTMPLANGVSSLPQGFRVASSYNVPTASPGKFPMLSQDARVISAFARSTSQQYPLQGASFHNRQVSQQEHNGHRIPSSSSSVSTHTVRPERYEFTGSRNTSYGSRHSITQQSGPGWIKDWKKVVTFNDKTQLENEDPDNTHSVYLRYMKEDFFDSPEFRQILNECGKVCDMTYYKPKIPGSQAFGQVFVHFTSTEFVKNAINRLNGYRLSDGHTIEASQALPRNSLYNHKEHSYNPKRVSSNASSRRPSIHTQSQAYKAHQYSNQQSRAPSPTRREPLTDGFQRQLLSATVQLKHNQFNAHRLGQPLEDISNSQKIPDLQTRYPMSSKENLPSKLNFQTPSGSPKKENIPFKRETKTPSTTPRNLTPHGAQKAQNGQKQLGKKKGKKGGRKTAESSAQPTPNGSPTKSMVDLVSLANDETKKLSQLNVVTAAPEVQSTSVALAKKSAKGQLEPRKQQKALTTAPPSPNNSSHTSFTSSFLNTAPPSREASALSLSSVALSDDPTPKVDLSKDKDECVETSNLTPTKKPTKSKKKTASKVSITLPISLPENIESAGTNPTANELDVKKIADHKSVEALDAQAGPLKSRKKGKHVRKESANHDPVRKADSKLATTKIESSKGPSDSKAQAKNGYEKKEGPEIPANLKTQSKKAGEKKSAKDSAPPKAQMEKTVDKTPDVTAPNSESGDSNEPFKLGCDEQFPSLEPGKSPAFTIADGKRPAAPKSLRGPPPAMGQFNQSLRTPSSQALKNQSQSQSKPAVPVPRISMPGKKPQDLDEWPILHGAMNDENIDTSLSWSGLVSDSQVNYRVDSPVDINSLGSRTWPFVKSFRKV